MLEDYKMYLLNSFSLNMLSNLHCQVRVSEIPEISARNLLTDYVDKLVFNGISALGHADTATVVSDILGVEVPCNRMTVTLRPGDRAIVAQYIGPRLMEGATELPANAYIKWVMIEIE